MYEMNLFQRIQTEKRNEGHLVFQLLETAEKLQQFFSIEEQKDKLLIQRRIVESYN